MPELLIDKVDIGLLAHPWRIILLGRNKYLQCTRKPYHLLLLHRVIAKRMGLNIQKPFEVDHINANGLDNRRSNLRVVTRQGNNANQRKTRGSSRFKGVSWDKEKKLWRASIKIDQKSKFLGRFHEEESAAKVYDEAAIIAFGEFARTNFGVAVNP
jgi:hypothetical protein